MNTPQQPIKSKKFKTYLFQRKEEPQEMMDTSLNKKEKKKKA